VAGTHRDEKTAITTFAIERALSRRDEPARQDGTWCVRVSGGLGPPTTRCAPWNPWTIAFDRVARARSSASASRVGGVPPRPLSCHRCRHGRIDSLSPASLCGLTGMKPTYGLISRAASFRPRSNLDFVGPTLTPRITSKNAAAAEPLPWLGNRLAPNASTFSPSPAPRVDFAAALRPCDSPDFAGMRSYIPRSPAPAAHFSLQRPAAVYARLQRWPSRRCASSEPLSRGAPATIPILRTYGGATLSQSIAGPKAWRCTVVIEDPALDK